MSVHELAVGERIRYPSIGSPSEIGSIRGDEEQPKVAIVDDCLFVAVGKEVKENKSTVIWALQNSGGKKIWILHVHIVNKTGKSDAMRKEMLKTLDEYVQLCATAGVKAQKIFIEAESIENGIVTLISQNMIGRLVMGAAADNRYNRRMTQLKSTKAIYVKSHAPAFCHILFVCKGYPIFTREGVKPPDADNESAEMALLRARLRTITELSENESDIYQRRSTSGLSSDGGNNTTYFDAVGWSTPRRSNGSSPESERSSRLRVSYSARPSTSSSVFRGSPKSDGTDIPQLSADLALAVTHLEEKYVGSSSPPRLLQRSVGDDLYDRLDNMMAEVDKLKDDANLESIKRRKAEKETIEAIRKAKETGFLLIAEQMRRNESDEKLGKLKKEHEFLKIQHAQILEELGSVLLQKTEIESEFEKSKLVVDELDEKIFSAVGLLEKYRKERDDLEIELDNALLEVEQLRKQLARVDPRATQVSTRFFADFTYSEILEATNNFNPTRKVGEGGFGSTYKGLLRHTEVAIKVLSLDSLQGLQEFKQEVDTLSKLRHPNIVTLIGVCSEASALIYEYYPNGSLDYRLACQDNTPPLSWQKRICIAAELCSVLIFLHSCQPESIIHGDLKPANILLDARFSCKLSDFGICRAIYNGESSAGGATRFYKTDPKGTFAYMDPEFLSTGELTPKSDVYSFGIILLSLLTGKSALGIIKEVKDALDKDDLNSVLDHSAGDWPFVQANQLALLGLRCCEMQRYNRPDLEADVWRVLEPMRISSGSSPLANVGRDEYDNVPSYFVCPIFQEAMQDPQIAADGFTYEAEALKGWLDSGHDTSPMTNLKLANHTLIPNRALRSAIQEWLQRQKCT